jgi:hypothetical protein
MCIDEAKMAVWRKMEKSRSDLGQLFFRSKLETGTSAHHSSLEMKRCTAFVARAGNTWTTAATAAAIENVWKWNKVCDCEWPLRAISMDETSELKSSDDFDDGKIWTLYNWYANFNN